MSHRNNLLFNAAAFILTITKQFRAELLGQMAWLQMSYELAIGRQFNATDLWQRN